ncbi:MAG: hypothetical protein GY805_20345 [Chloroflexi bacterium]|nr:hypothetical protein [Chloroflexota bacterium]
MDTTKDDILRSLQARLFALDQGAPEHQRRFMLTKQNLFISEGFVNEFMSRLHEVLKEFTEDTEEKETEYQRLLG